MEVFRKRITKLVGLLWISALFSSQALAFQPLLGFWYPQNSQKIYNTLPYSYGWPLIGALADYNGNTPLDFSAGSASASITHSKEVSPWPYNPYALAFADITFLGAIVMTCDIGLNPLSNGLNGSSKQMLIAHEIGHCAGLEHNTLPGELMFTTGCWIGGVGNAGCFLTTEAIIALDWLY